MTKSCSRDSGSEKNEKKSNKCTYRFEIFFFMKKFDSSCLERYVNLVKR